MFIYIELKTSTTRESASLTSAHWTKSLEIAK